MDGELSSDFSRKLQCTDLGLRLPWPLLSCVTSGQVLASLILCFYSLK